MKLFGLTLILSCFVVSVDASQTKSQYVSLSNIHEISIDAIKDKFNDGDIRGIKLHLVQKNKEQLRITAPSNLMPKIRVQNSNGELSIDIVPLSHNDVKSGRINIHIATKAVKKIKLIGQIDTILSDHEAVEPIDIAVQKGGILEASSLTGPKITLKSAFGSHINFSSISSSQLICSANFGATISIVEASHVKNLEASATYGGTVSAPLLKANY